MSIIILGISAFYHDSAAALLIDGEIIAAAQEERFTRNKNDATFPVNSISYVVREAGIDFNDLTACTRRSTENILGQSWALRRANVATSLIET